MLNKLMKSNIFIINLYGFFLYLRRYYFYLKSRKYLKKNKELINKKKNKKIYIIGTGPSLKNIDLKKIKGDTLVLNNFYKYNSPKEFIPNYCMIIDNYFFTENKELIKETIKKYPKINLILNGKYIKDTKKIVKNLNNIYFIQLWKGYFSEKKIIDFSKVESSFINVSCCAVAYSIYLEYKEIYLLGIDFNSFVSKNSHCYNENRNISNIKNDLYGFSMAIDIHEKLYKYAQKKGIKIVNINDNSLLDVYPQSKEEYKNLS